MGVCVGTEVGMGVCVGTESGVCVRIGAEVGIGVCVGTEVGVGVCVGTESGVGVSNDADTETTVGIGVDMEIRAGADCPSLLAIRPQPSNITAITSDRMAVNNRIVVVLPALTSDSRPSFVPNYWPGRLHKFHKVRKQGAG